MSDVDSMLKQFLEEKKEISGSERTIQTYHSTLKLFRKQLQNKGLDLFPLLETEAQVDDYRETLIKEIKQYVDPQSMRKSTSKLRRSVLSSFYRFLQTKIYFPNPVMQDGAVKKKRKNTRLTQREFIEAIKNIEDSEVGKRDKAILCLMLELGLPNWIINGVKANQFYQQNENIEFGLKKERKKLTPYTSSAIIELGVLLYGDRWTETDMPLFVSYSPAKKGKYEQITFQGISGILERRIGERTPYMETDSFISAVSSIGKK